MKSLLTLALLLLFSSAFAQWERVTQLPASLIYTLYSKNGTLYAGGKAVVYYSSDRGQTWDSTSKTPSSAIIDNIFIYKNELYCSVLNKGVFKSPDNGVNWQNISTGILPSLSAFVEFRGNLYASTWGAGVFKLDSIRRDRWESFNNGLSDLSSNATSMVSTKQALVAGTLRNSIYDRLTGNSSTWDERLLFTPPSAGEGTQALLAIGDSLLMAGYSGSLYLSTDAGNSWRRFANTNPVDNTTLTNTRQAFLIARTQQTNGTFSTFFKYLKKDSLDHPFVNFSFVENHFNLKIEVYGDQIWDASATGLYHMPLSLIPGITAEEDPLQIPLPVHFESFNAQLLQNRTVLLTWRVSNDANAHHFIVERSADTVNWESLWEIPISPAADYSFTDLSPKSGINYYRIKETDIDGRTTYSIIRSIELKDINNIRIYPNPVADILKVNLPFSNGRAIITDALGRTIYKGIFKTNQLTIHAGSFKTGIYYLSIQHGNEITTLNFLKQ